MAESSRPRLPAEVNCQPRFALHDLPGPPNYGKIPREKPTSSAASENKLSMRETPLPTVAPGGERLPRERIFSRKAGSRFALISALGVSTSLSLRVLSRFRSRSQHLSLTLPLRLDLAGIRCHELRSRVELHTLVNGRLSFSRAKSRMAWKASKEALQPLVCPITHSPPAPRLQILFPLDCYAKKANAPRVFFFLPLKKASLSINENIWSSGLRGELTVADSRH